MNNIIDQSTFYAYLLQFIIKTCKKKKKKKKIKKFSSAPLNLWQLKLNTLWKEYSVFLTISFDDIN